MEAMSEHKARRLIAGASMLFAPLLLLAVFLFAPEPTDKAATMVARLTAHADAATAFAIVGLVGTIMLVPALLGLMHLLRERAPRLEIVAGAVAIVGVICMGALMGIRLMSAELGQLVAGGAAAGPLTDLVDKVINPSGLMVALYAGTAAFAAGMVLMAYGLVRCGTAPRWAALVMGVGVVVLVVGQLLFIPLTTIVGAIAFTVGLAAIGMELLFETDEEWEHPVEFEGWGGLLPQH